MKWQDFDRIYVHYQPHVYPQKTVESALKCIKAPEQRKQVYEFANKCRRISRRQAISDISLFFDCLKRCYSGYDFFFTDDCCEKIHYSIDRKIRRKLFGVKNLTLCNWIYEALKDIVNDSHFGISVCGWEWRFYKQYIAYVTDLIVRKTPEGCYEVIRGNDTFKEGHLFSVNDLRDYLLPTLIVREDINKQDKCFLLGKYTQEETAGIEVAGKWVQTHRIRADRAKKSDEERFVQKGNCVILNHKTYDMPYDEELCKEYYDEGVKCSKEDNIILNLTGNSGGKSVFATSFYDGLCGLDDTYFWMAKLPFPWELQHGVKSYSIEMRENDYDTPRTFDGTVYVVMNKDTGSSTEMGVSPALHLQNSVLVGSGTFGCCTFGDCLLYQLPCSGIAFSYGHKVFYHDSFEEGKGFVPDYWIDDEDPVSVVEKYIAQQIERCENDNFDEEF